jgi:hypothetical protein
MENDRIAAINLVFDIREARPHLDEDGDTVGLVDQLDTASRLRRFPIVRLNSRRVIDQTPDLLITGELVMFRSTVPITLPGRLIPAGPASSLVALSAAARVSLKDLGFNSPLKVGAEWLATDPIEIVLDTLWSRSTPLG